MSIPECWFFVSSTSQLVFHVGSSLLLFSLNCGNRRAPMLPHSTKPWYYASEFPVEVVAVPTDGTHPVTTTSDHPTKLLLQVADSTWLYMCVVAALDQDGGSRCRRRVGIFFAWNVLDGSFQTLRLVSVPLHTPLNTASDAMLLRCRRAISSIQATTHPPTTCSNSSWSSSVPSFNMWTNAGVLCGTSVGRLDNPAWPYAISR
ncbi:hypothetical protein B5M09_003884 [Aphanomyces astaci]|uniref:Uncharacterized protein n=1 Tax=Aphanomyces astaci TaxID=112090 RepID=A0A425D3C6_APHAT|nr:hypothetical protein B5M09_003884 [Aphanomyces astaci]